MKILELFCGTKSFSKVAIEMGHAAVTADWDKQFNPDILADVAYLSVKDIGFKPDIIWASPPCECFSIAAVSHNWTVDRKPRRIEATQAWELVKHTVKLIERLSPKYYFIENPRGLLRKLPPLNEYPRRTVTYCQYGDTRMKPTDIWTNCDKWIPRPMCKNGSPCHVAAPRGSRTGTQGLKNKVERSRVPKQLCEEILRCAK